MKLNLAALAALLFLAAVPSWATPVSWQLTSGFPTGGFKFDADTNLYSDINITFGGGHFAAAVPSSDAASLTVHNLGLVLLGFNFSSPLTNSGGTRNYSGTLFFPNGGEVIESFSGSVSAVPLPAAFPLLALAIASLGFLAFRQTRSKSALA